MKTKITNLVPLYMYDQLREKELQKVLWIHRACQSGNDAAYFGALKKVYYLIQYPYLPPTTTEEEDFFELAGLTATATVPLRDAGLCV